MNVSVISPCLIYSRNLISRCKEIDTLLVYTLNSVSREWNVSFKPSSGGGRGLYAFHSFHVHFPQSDRIQLLRAFVIFDMEATKRWPECGVRIFTHSRRGRMVRNDRVRL